MKMHPRASRPAPQRSVAAAVATVLAIVCLVQLQMLIRPRLHASGGGAAEEEKDGFAGGGSGSNGGGGSSGSSDGAAKQQQEDPLPHGFHDPCSVVDLGVGGGTWKPRRERAAAAGSGSSGGQQQHGGSAAGSPMSPESLLAPISGAPMVFVTFGNGAFGDFMHNWVLGVQRLGIPFVIGALDDEMASQCALEGWPHLALSSRTGGNSSFFRTNFKSFRNMGATKVHLVLSMLELHNVGIVMVSDSDVSWLGDPTPYLDQHPTADWFMSTDCLSAQVEAEWKPWHNQPRCGHVAKNTWGRAFNTGIFAVRNNPETLKLLALWRDFLQDPERSQVRTATNVTLGITDQLALNMLLDNDTRQLQPAPEDPRTILLRSQTLRLHPLPVLQFPSGHVAFVQRLPWKYGVDPFVVHATFQRYSTMYHRLGKRGRFREFGMWFLDGEEYYNPPGARYLTYQHDVRRAVQRVAEERFGGAMPILYKHMVAMSYQLAVFRDALATARMLNRILVLPKSWCYCDYDWTPHVLEKCKIRGSDLRLPFECPADFVFHIPLMELKNMSFRMPGFLESPQVPVVVRRWRADVEMMLERPRNATTAGLQGGLLSKPVGHPEGMVWPGMTSGELASALSPYNASAVLTISAMQPGLLRGLASPAENAAFDADFKEVTKELYWCCASEWNASISSFVYEMPKPFAALAAAGSAPLAAWEPPKIAMPRYCGHDVGPKNREYLLYANHPCQFLNNATAAMIAADFT